MQFYSIKELAKILKLHPKTILRFIHEGKIEAQKVGRSWRVSREALKKYTHAELAFSERSDKSVESEPMSGRVRVSAVIEINEHNSEEASRISNSLMAGLNCKDPTWGNTKVDFLYYPEIQKAKYIVFGTPAIIGEIMNMLNVLEGVGWSEE